MNIELLLKCIKESEGEIKEKLKGMLVIYWESELPSTVSMKENHGERIRPWEESEMEKGKATRGLLKIIEDMTQRVLNVENRRAENSIMVIDSYRRGKFNGLELAMATLEKRTPNYKSLLDVDKE